jgi:hypothetical protein
MEIGHMVLWAGPLGERYPLPEDYPLLGTEIRLTEISTRTYGGVVTRSTTEDFPLGGMIYGNIRNIRPFPTQNKNCITSLKRR